jgi:hypothetical protein
MLLRRACAADRQYSAKRIAGPSTRRLLRFAWHRRPPIFERQIDSFRISPSIASQHSVIRRTTPGPPVWRIGSYGDILSLQWKLVPAIFNASQPGRHRRRENDGRAGTMNFENRNGKSSRIPPRTYLTCRSSGQINSTRIQLRQALGDSICSRHRAYTGENTTPVTSDVGLPVHETVESLARP